MDKRTAETGEECGSETMNEPTVPVQAAWNGQAVHADGKGRRIGSDFIEQLGRLVILWGDIEALTRTLTLMKGQGQNFRAKTDEELMKEYRRDKLSFDKHLKAVLPHQTAMARGILKLKDLRDFALHGTVIKWKSANAEGEKDAIIHVDATATVLAQEGFMSRSLESIVPRARKLEGDGSVGPPILTTDGLRQACDNLAGYVYDLRLFRTVLQVKDGSDLHMKVYGGGHGAHKSRGKAGRTKSPPQTPRCIAASVFQNPADVISHDQKTALRLGEFCRSFSPVGPDAQNLGDHARRATGALPGAQRAKDGGVVQRVDEATDREVELRPWEGKSRCARACRTCEVPKLRLPQPNLAAGNG